MRFRQLKKGSFSQTREATIRLGVRDGWVSVLINKEPAQLNLFGPSIRKDLRTFSFGRGKRKKREGEYRDKKVPEIVGAKNRRIFSQVHYEEEVQGGNLVCRILYTQ